MAIKLDPFNGYAHFELGKIYEQILKVNFKVKAFGLWNSKLESSTDGGV